MHHFITRTQTTPPPIPIFWYGVMIGLLVLSIYASLTYYKNPKFVRLFKWIQIAQLLALYTWYIGFGIPFSNSLPLYHCRLAMFAVVFLPDKWKLSSILPLWEPVEQYLPWATLFLTPMTSRILPVFLFSLVIMPFWSIPWSIS